ncbi:MAG: tRNA (guanosine(46)-N7)-methyltransferase TrmB [Alphaproteobacteria bacterium]|jgi:tRNA (guanine-N7-)-methyltransferase
MADAAQRRRVFYGRRHGRRLRPARAALLARNLESLSIDLSKASGSLPDLFTPPAAETWLEIGFGGGEHLAAQAQARPDIGFIGCEPFMNGVARLMSEIEAKDIGNIRLHADDARDLLDVLPGASISRCFIMFPDPWPKVRHHNRRMVSTQNLNALARVLSDGAELRMASDHMEYIRWMLFHVLRHDAFEWQCDGPADWRDRPADGTPTRYEQKALSQGDACVYLRFRRRNR